MSENIAEKIADKTHEIWCNWMKHLFSKCEMNEDGTATIPKHFVDRWIYQTNTKYEDLSEDDKQKDRDVFQEYYGDLVDIKDHE